MSAASPGWQGDAPDVSRSSVGELLGHVSRDLSTLMRQEVQLAKAEVRQEGKVAGRTAGIYAGAGLAGFLVLLFLSMALWWGLSNVMDQGWAALIVAVLWAIIGAFAYSAARRQAQHVKGLRHTTQTIAEIPDALKGNQS